MENFKGWFLDVENGILYDPAGNRYTPPRVRSSLETLELARELVGSPLQILSLKQKLQAKTQPVRLQIDLEIDGSEVKIKASKVIKK